MSDRNHQPTTPMRIELATSQIEGGGYLSWADPEQVIACIAHAQPPETFARFIEPRLAELDEVAVEGASAPGKLPPRVRSILDRLREVHTRLYRENRSPMRDARWAKLVVASVEESRIFFIKGTSCWIYRIRDGVSSRVCHDEDPASYDSSAPGLGESGKLSLAVTSLEICPDDLVVLMAAPGGGAPDPRSVYQPIVQTQDLRRACDGLTNLLCLQAPAAAVVAFRFIPVAASAMRELSGTSVIEDLERDLIGGLERGDPEVHVESPEALTPHKSVDSSEIPLPAFLEEAGPPGRAEECQPEPSLPAFLQEGEARPNEPGNDVAAEAAPIAPETDFRFPWEEADRRPMAEEQMVELEAAPVDRELEAPVESEVWVETAVSNDLTTPSEGWADSASDESGVEARGLEDRGPNEPAEPSRDDSEFEPVRRERSLGLWAASFGLVLLLFVAVLAIPRGLEMWKAKSPGPVGSGVLRIEPTPPARAIYVDGVDMQTGSPAILEGIATGLRTIRMDLGAFGTLERQVTIADGETVDLVLQAFGSLEVESSLPRDKARSWIPGRSPRSVPCRFDSLPVGLVDVFYEDEQIPLWQREVVIRAGGTHRVRVNNAIASDRSHLRIESWHYRAGEGLFETVGDSVFVDRQYFGTTPWEGELAPGFHGVRVLAAGGDDWTEVIESAGGSSRVIAPRFGMSDWPHVNHLPPGRVAIHGPLLLTATVIGPDEAQPWDVRLHFPGLDATLRDLPLSAVDPAVGVYVGVVRPESVPKDREVSYYFTVETSSGQTVSSELYRLTAVAEISQVVNP